MMALEWHKTNTRRWKPSQAAHVMETLIREVFPTIGAKPIDQITAPDVIAVLRPIQARGTIEAAHRLRNRISGAFGLAIANGYIEHAPAARVGKAMMPIVKDRKHPAVVTPEDARRVLASVDTIPAHPVTRIALRLLALTALRPGELRAGRWSEIEDLDGKEPVWRIGADRMKNTRERLADATDHVVPLSRQAVEAFRALRPLSGHSLYLFPSSQRYSDRPISEQALCYLLSRAGQYGRQVPHGWRATFSTVMNELHPVDRAVIDLMLAHSPKDRIESRYNRSTHTAR
jgi:integrase